MMIMKVCVLLLFYFTFGICDSASSSLHEVEGTVIFNQSFSRAGGPYLVTSDLVIAENATLTVEAGTEILLVPNVGIRVYGTLLAKGTHSQRITFRAISCNETKFCNSTKLYNPGIRLVDGTSYSSGRLELEWNGQWGTVCSWYGYWNRKNIEVACRQLGFLGARRSYHLPGSSGPIWISSVRCSGNEEDLWQCGYRGIGQTGCRHNRDIAIECDTLVPFLTERVYWKGFYFSPSNLSEKQGNSYLEHVDIVNAFEGIKALKKPPALFNVTVRDGLTGVLATEIEEPLRIVNSTIVRCDFVGINVTSIGTPVEIQGVTVQNTKYGEGLVYNGIAGSVDFCSIIPENASLPLVLNVSGNSLANNCSKIFRASPGETLSVHFQLISGSGFEFNVTDGSTSKKTLLSRIINDYNGKTIKTSSSSVLEIDFYSEKNAKIPCVLEIVIMKDQGQPVALRISESNFVNNFKNGISINSLIGQCQISNTVAAQNGFSGLNTVGTYGTVDVKSSTFLSNRKLGMHAQRISATVSLTKLNSSKNQESGILFDGGTVSLVMSGSIVQGNAFSGVLIQNQLNSTINITSTNITRNIRGLGIYLLDFTEHCYVRLLDVVSYGHSRGSGAYFERLNATNLIVTSSSFDENGWYGLSFVKVVAHKLILTKISTSRNYRSGVYISGGSSTLNIKSWSSVGNTKHGFYLEKQDGVVSVKGCQVSANKMDGLRLVDDHYARLKSFRIQNCTVLKNRYGIVFELSFVSYNKGPVIYDVSVADTTIANSTFGGCEFYSSTCSINRYSKNRHLQLSFTRNKVTGNQKFGLLFTSPELFQTNATLEANVFKENIGYSLGVSRSHSCSYNTYTFPVSIDVLKNIFVTNTGEFIVYVDYSSLPDKRFMIIKNNTFLNNKCIHKFSTKYIRTNTQAVLALHEGNFTVEHNSFDNSLFPHEMATFVKDHDRVIQATENWWGSRDECQVKERIFDFEDRVELAQIQYYPFLIHYNSTNAKRHNDERPLCFLLGNKVGGTLNRSVTVPKDSAIYQVTGDVIVLPNGILTIEENVTFEFPLQAVFLVYGQVIIKGTNVKRVKFIPRTPREDIRLVDGPGPWEGTLEMWFNNTWMPVCLSRYSYESTIVCRQLGYEGNGYWRRYSSGKENVFLHNVRCDTDENDNVLHCNREKWISLSYCSNYVAYIQCKISFWAGIHLPITPKRSVITNLDISYAGFAYRNDLSIPGIALRVDLSHHNITGITVDKAASIGVQIMYPDPFKSSHDLADSTISNTESDGIRLDSPYGNIVNNDVVNTKGRGFLFDSNWNPLSVHVVTMTEQKLKRYLNPCVNKDVFLDNSSLVYYLVVTPSSQQDCTGVIEVPQDYRIALQLIYQGLKSNFVFHVYGGINKTAGALWDVHSLTGLSRPAWKSNKSSVLLESSPRHHGYGRSVHFMLYLMKAGNDNTEMESPNLVISDSNFISNNLGGIVLSNGRGVMGYVAIQSCVICNSPGNGLQTALSSIKNIKLVNCSLHENYNAIMLSAFSGNVSIENTTISNSTHNALYVPSDGQKTLHLSNSRIVHNKGDAVHVYGDSFQLHFFATNSFFGWNKATTVYSEIRYPWYHGVVPITFFKNCTFLMNKGPVINIKQSSSKDHWEFEGNLFMRNTQPSVILTTQDTRSNHVPAIYIRKNQFLYNLCQEKGVIDVIGGTKELIIDGNLFEGNSGRSIFLEETSFASITAQNNVFKGNNCSDKGTVEVRAMDKEIVIVRNVFESNKGLFMVLLHCGYYIELKMVNKLVNFTSNSFLNNSMVSSRSLACEFNISGLIDYKTFSLHHNIFNSHHFPKELCVNIFASSHTSSLDLSLNFWGYDGEADIRKRIFDAETDYEQALASFAPFLDRSGRTIYRSNKPRSFEADGSFGGRLSSTVHFNVRYSPYKVVSDLTILPQASLIINPGVEVQFTSGVGMLVLGSLFVYGNETHPVTFSLLRKNQSKTAIPVRLVAGTFPWQGRVEVMYHGKWTPLCLNNTTPSAKMRTAKVICEQLGYQKPSMIDSNINQSVEISSEDCALSVSPRCRGNESEIGECVLNFQDHSSNSSRPFVLTCTGGVPWGNIRFVKEFNNSHNLSKSTLEHLMIEHCGRKHGNEVAAIEAFQYVPEVHSVHVLNCTAGGFKTWFPEKEIYLRNSSFINTGGIGTEILITQQNVNLDKISSIGNNHGVSFHEPTGQWMDGLSYGQVMFCASQSVINLANGDVYLYFRPPFMTYYNPSVNCMKVVRTGANGGFAIKLLVMKNVEYITIEDTHKDIILKYSTRAQSQWSSRRLVPRNIVKLVPWNTITLYFKGWFSTSEVLLHLKRVDDNDFPCTFQRGNCGWNDYPGSTVDNIALTWKWYWTDINGYHSGLPDHTYSYYGGTGNFMWLGLRYWYDGYGAFSSTPILKHYNYCYLVFYYILKEAGHASLSVFIEESGEKNLTSLWSTNKTRLNWKKKVLALPRTLSNYSVVFLGYFGIRGHYVGIDDIVFKRCDSPIPTVHRITESTFSGNLGHGISYTSAQMETHLFRIERSKIVNNGLSPSLNKIYPGAIFLNASNQVFQIFNNYLAKNRNGTLYSTIQNDESAPNQPISQLHANTIESNKGGTVFLEGISGAYLTVKVTDNYFSVNLAMDLDHYVHSICNISNLVAHLRGNFFYNNSGQYVLEYSFPVTYVTGLTFLNNTLFRNHGLGVNYGATILCNGRAEMHGNVIENPRNHYQISTTWQGGSIIVNATLNWWGEGVLTLIAPLIMDSTKDNKLSLKVIFQPFIQLQPQRVLSTSCPPEWIKDEELCFLYKGGSFTFREAKANCENYGGNVITMFTGDDVRLVKCLRREESLVRPTAVPALWTMKRNVFREESRSESLPEKEICSIVDKNGNITQADCNSLHPFVCVRRPVVYCPNGCFHHGDCVGAICFCYPGWSGEDCSQFHCQDLHNCSGNGKCMGPNVCKCYPGYLGLGCTYSYCGKYGRCSDCVTDPFCGWCDSSRSCLGGFAEGPPSIVCPSWFYYHCYTVGDEKYCSSNISRVDCRGKHCNFEDGQATIESCQKCRDLEKCYKIKEMGRCRGWNETSCPGGKVHVDYTDPQRVYNVELAKNLKVVEPNTTTIYACPVMLDKEDQVSAVFVAPKDLNVKEGDILLSPQAGGIMHKIVTERTNGPFKMMLSAPVGLEEVINYADFKEEAIVESAEDESTLEEEPDQQDLQDLTAGSITVNEGRIINLESVTYKCLGHSYDVGDVSVHSYYLVIENNITIPRSGDVLISNTSDGFIESVVAVHNASEDTLYLETKLQRCNENSRLNSSRLIQSKRRFYESTFCSGGDNNPGLIVSARNETDEVFAVNDSIVGRPSSGFIAKVVKVNSTGEFLLVEVISAQLTGNRTMSTAVEIGQLQHYRRRTRRSTTSFQKTADFSSGQITHKIISYDNAEVVARLSFSLHLTALVDIDKNRLGEIKDASFGLKLQGSLDASLQIKIIGGLGYSSGVMSERQLGSTKYIRFGVIPVSVGVFLGLEGSASARMSGSLSMSAGASGSFVLGGECRWSRKSCYKTDNSTSLKSTWNRPKAKTGTKLDARVMPTISIKMPVAPKFKMREKTSLLNKFKNLVTKALKFVDVSFSIYAKVPLRAGIAVVHPTSQCQGRTPAAFRGYYGVSDLIFGVSVSFIGKQMGLKFKAGFCLLKHFSECFCPPGLDRKSCTGPTAEPTASEQNSDPCETKKKKRKQGKIPGSPCGEEPVCAGMRMGPNCTQPDTHALRNCSGNGIPGIAPNCRAYCDCFGGWEGEFCEIISARGGGDPHLETIDGVHFDFFGIGEFWGCKSNHNDFGIQFRFFYYDRASLIGGVSIKAGQSLVTVMTIKSERAQDSPIVRIDGILINVTNNSSEPIAINNGSVLMDRQVRFTFEDEDNSVVLISLQYQSGVTVTIDVKHSQVMKRQYLNVLYSPTAAYKGRTQGLCGFMDNNATNDFMGPDGTLYEDAVQFAESWRITDCHDGSGTRDSWSWNSSNFYHEDTMDLSYTDPSFHPIYTLQGISQPLLQLATSMCKSLNISESNLQSCIFDVAVTNDTTFTDQENFKQGCPDKCSGKGRCVNGTCRCIDGWAGDSCSQGSCVNCSAVHGKCVKGFCVCHLGWEGRSCEIKATCHNVNNCTSSVHGICKTTDICQCNPGYVGLDCSIIPTCYNVSNCTGNGICVDFDVCKCEQGWNGTNCTQYSCEYFDYCSGRGRCVAFDTCACDNGWTGGSCALPDCATVNQCSGKGECVSSNLCRCYPGFIGTNCSELADCSELANCSGHGVCVSLDSFNVSCSCYAGFTGPNCSQPTCTTLNNCSEHGKCTEAELCKCDMGYNGTDCSNFSCEAVNFCSGHGQCVGYDLCKCNSSWSGPACNNPDCSGVNNCSDQGDCILVNTCTCYPAFDGELCDRKAKPNTNPPRFDKQFYKATVLENSPAVTLILQVHANDTDLGRNGQIFYSVMGDRSAENSLSVDGATGKVYNSFVFDFETLKTPKFNVTLMASDNGFPQKSGTATVQITVADENDNCPTFIEPSGNLQLDFFDTRPGVILTKVSATDLDSGTNGDITYTISSNDVNDDFFIDPKTGVVNVTSNLTKSEYQLTVGASDHGEVSCLTEISLTVKVTSLPTKKPPKKPPTSSVERKSKTSTPSTTSSTSTTTTKEPSKKPLTSSTEKTSKTATPSETSSTSTTTELTEPTGTDSTRKSTTRKTSFVSPTETAAEPQTSQNYVVIGVSAFGGLLALVIVAVLMKKFVCKSGPSPAMEIPAQSAKVNESFQGDMELSTMFEKM